MSDLSELRCMEESSVPLRPVSTSERLLSLDEPGDAPAAAQRACRRTPMAVVSLVLLGLVSAAVFFRYSRVAVDDPGEAAPARVDVPLGDAQLIGKAEKALSVDDPDFCEKEYKQPPGWGCTYSARTFHKEGYNKCCKDEILPRVLLFDRAFKNYMPPMKTCALVGSSSLLQGLGKGWEIDNHDVVIRINRYPTEEFKADFGEKGSIFMMAVTSQLTGKVPLMGSGDLKSCDELENCKWAGLNFLQAQHDDCPVDMLKDIWGTEHHHFIGCPSWEVKQLSYAMSTRTDDGFKHVEGVMSTGFVAILQFAPLCGTMDVYGFGGKATADGHIEWDGHPLEMEHQLEHQLADRRYWDIQVDGQFQGFWQKWQETAGEINMK